MVASALYYILSHIKLTIVTDEFSARFLSCKNSVSKVFGANVSFRKDIREGDAASV